MPDNFDVGIKYDKWGNEILKNGTRMKGELFFNEGVQKVLAKANMLEVFTDFIKYPRTPHMPSSLGATNDDKMLSNLNHFNNLEVVITEKMDGENTTLYHNYTHARSLDSRNHPSRNLLKQFHARICHDIPERMRICGENLFAKHSIYYENLMHHFLGFSMWDENNTCLDWDNTTEWFELIGVTPVPVLWRGIYSEAALKDIVRNLDLNKQEGIVLRVSDEFNYSQFNNSIAKFVRNNHVGTANHWMKEDIIPNIFENPHDS